MTKQKVESGSEIEVGDFSAAPQNDEKGLFGRVYELVKKVPAGKVTTYGEIARVLGLKDVRKVGWALHGNKDPEVPCHRVVNREGGLAPNFAFDGAAEQRRRLELEGVRMVSEMKVDLESCGFHF